jgi:hypothetical protein
MLTLMEHGPHISGPVGDNACCVLQRMLQEIFAGHTPEEKFR